MKRRLTIAASVLALVLAACVPALAQLSNEAPSMSSDVVVNPNPSPGFSPPPVPAEQPPTGFLQYQGDLQEEEPPSGTADYYVPGEGYVMGAGDCGEPLPPDGFCATELYPDGALVQRTPVPKDLLQRQ